MAPIGTIYGYKAHTKVSRTLAAAAINGVEVTVAETKPSEGQCKTPEYTSKFPMGKIPAFEGADGFKLHEGSAIAYYVASLNPNTNLLGQDEKSRALVAQWTNWADSELFDNGVRLAFIYNGWLPYNKPTDQASWDGIHRALTYLESHLQAQTFLVGHRITLADLTVASTLDTLFNRYTGKDVRDKYPNVTRYAQTIINQPKLSSVYSGGKEWLAESAKYVPPKKEAAPKPAAAAAAPKAAKAPKAKKEAEDDDDEPLVPAEPKTRNPLDDLPKSSFNLEDWKRIYSNKDTYKEALPWFYENFDAEGYSIWRIDYKYNDELTQVFMSSNLIGGFFSRLEASRKYVMGSAGVFGENNASAISGVIVLRGQDWKPVLSVAPDIDSYDVKAVDLKDAAQKKYFEDVLAWEAELDGKKWADGKQLK